MTRITDLHATLRTLDPADRDVDPQHPHARAMLERILMTDPGRPDGTQVRSRSRRRMRVAVAVSATAVTAGASLVILPSLTNGDRAFASWTATPGDMTVQDAADAAANCRDSMFDAAGSDYDDELRRADVAIAERRGEWTLVELSGAEGFSALCITDESTPLFRDMIGSVGSAAVPTPGAREVVATDLGSGSMSAGTLSVAVGQVGSDVTGVTYQSAGHGEVAATVSAGRFAFWLPGDELESQRRDGVEVLVTYEDGTTATLRLHLGERTE